MESRKAIVVQEGCAVCDYVKSVLKEKGLDVEIIDASTREGYDKAVEHGIKSVPGCLVITPGEDGETSRDCTTAEFKELIEVKKK